MSHLAVNHDEQLGSPVAGQRQALRRETGLRMLQRAAGNRLVGRMLMRQAAASSEESPRIVSTRLVEPDVVIVEMDDGSRYWVRRIRTRVRRPVVSKTFDPPPSMIGTEDDKVFVRLNWLRLGAYKPGEGPADPLGTPDPEAKGARENFADKLKDVFDNADKGQRVKALAADAQKVGTTPDEAKRLLDLVAKEIAKGSGADTVVNVVEADLKKLNAFAAFDIGTFAGVALSGSVDTTVTGSGATTPVIRIKGSNGPIDIGVEVARVSDPAPVAPVNPSGSRSQVAASITFTPGRRDPAPAGGSTEQLVVRQQTEYQTHYTFDLERQIPEHTERRVRSAAREEKQRRHLYFRSRAQIDLDRSKHERDLIDQAIASGFRVTGVEGFASPEGSLETRGRFPGNRALAEARASAAARFVGEQWPGQAAGDRKVTVAGRGELYGAGSADGRELTGRALEAEVVKRFRAQEGERFPEVLEQLGQVRSEHARANLVYPWLRRAVITLTRNVNRLEPFDVAIPGRTEYKRALAPPAVQKAAERQFLKDAVQRMLEPD